jgi:hypothetical protein
MNLFGLKIFYEEYPSIVLNPEPPSIPTVSWGLEDNNSEVSLNTIIDITDVLGHLFI